MMDYTLKNERLEVAFATPNIDYTGTRFDRIGMIKSVTLDEKDLFYAQESLIHGQGSNGQGFYNEFGIEEPIGYNDAKVGETFPKIGVGLLTKLTHTPYDFFTTYPATFFEYTTEFNIDSICFKSLHTDYNGYEMLYTKHIQLIKNKMLVRYTLENTGSKPIETTEYCHHFVAINHHPIGPDYELNFSFPLYITDKVGTFSVKESHIKFSNVLDDVIYGKFHRLPTVPNQWFELVHKPSGVGFSEHSDFTLERVAIWGMPHVISPETFIKISIQPNHSQTWERLYRFFN